MEILRSAIHYPLHFLFPGAVSYFLFQPRWKKAWLVMIGTMLVDLDHLLATPIFDANRCSISFHPLHSYYAIILYIILTLFPKTRIVGIGLLVHMVIDFSDCLLMF